MKIKKAVIAAAAPDQSQLPFQSLIDRRGQEKTALQLIVEEAVEAGIESICIVIRPGDRESFSKATAQYNNIVFVEQTAPQGYADALLRTESFVDGDDFLHFVGDHLYLSNTDTGCARQLVEVAANEECAVTAVQSTRERLLPYFGTIGASRLTENRLFHVNRVVEKPTPTEAEQDLVVAGLRAGFFLCVSGMHVLPASFLTILREEFEQHNIRHISSALHRLAERERYLAYELDGARFNIGVKYGLLRAQLELALSGDDRELILSELVEMLANRSLESDS